MKTLLLLLWAAQAASAWGGPCASPKASCLSWVFPPQGGKVAYYASHPLEDAHPELDTAVIMIHGVLRDADRYFKLTAKAAKKAGRRDTTLVLAPRFRGPEDKPAEPGELAWTSGWKVGRDAVGPAAVSSFEVVDALLSRLDKARYPALRQVVVAGHSAGGQFVSRYVVVRGSAPSPAASVRYITANPSTYLYLDRRRPDAGGAFSVPASTTCLDFDEYQYGFEKSPRVVEARAPAVREANARAADHILLLGETDVLEEYLDMSCGAMMQGPNRRARGEAYFRYLEEALPGHFTRLMMVPKTGHDAGDMFDSEPGREALFTGPR
ncbi:MAG: alpha/beta hydrolase [Elusimicrobia bacterium]|nr:alpha/beta hydrolase [Elusimicrobiota bacterium]